MTQVPLSPPDEAPAPQLNPDTPQAPAPQTNPDSLQLPPNAVMLIILIVLALIAGILLGVLVPRLIVGDGATSDVQTPAPQVADPPSHSESPPTQSHAQTPVAQPTYPDPPEPWPTQSEDVQTTQSYTELVPPTALWTDYDIDFLVIATAGVNMRYGPSLQYGVITTVPYHALVKLLGDDRGCWTGATMWAYISYEGQEGWIFSDYAQYAGDPDGFSWGCS